MSNGFLPEHAGERASWLRNFAAKLCLYAPRYAVSHEELLDVLAGSMIFQYWLDYKNRYEAYRSTCRNHFGIPDADSMVHTLPAPGSFWESPGWSDVFVLVVELASRIRVHTSFTDADGMDMGIGGMEDVNTRGRSRDMITPLAYS